MSLTYLRKLIAVVVYESDFHFQASKVAVLQLDFKIFPGLDPASKSLGQGFTLSREFCFLDPDSKRRKTLAPTCQRTLCFVSDSISPESIEGKAKHVPRLVSSTQWSPKGISAMWSNLRAFPRNGYELYNRWRCARFVPIAIYWTIDGDSLRSPL